MGILATEGGLVNRPYMAAWAGLWGETRRWRSTGGCKQKHRPSSLHPPIKNEHSTRLFDSLIAVNRFQPAGHKLSDPPGPSNTAENILNLLPPLAPNTRRAPKHILRVDSALDLEQTGVVVAPERFLPVRLVPRSLDFQQVNSRISDSTQKNHHHSPR